MRVSSLVGAAEDVAPPPHAHTRARTLALNLNVWRSAALVPHTHTLAPTLVGADVLGGPLHPPVLPLTSPSPQKI